MSKFTKALEKIQSDKQEKVKEAVKTKTHGFEIPQDGEKTQTLNWDRGIRQLRHTSPDTRVVIYHFPNGLLAEQYRMLRTNLKNQLGEKGSKVILLSSAIHGEGKTVTATNLAMTLAEMENTKVALVDADLRRGKVGDYLGFAKELPGLSNFLSNGVNAKEVMVRNSVENLVVIPRGEIIKNPSELVSSQKFRLLIAELRSRFDYILIDSPPIMSVADAGILGREADGLLMVIQSGRTPKSVISHAHLLFKQAGLKMLGYVLTNVEFQSADYRYHYYYYNDYDEQSGIPNRSTFIGRVKFYFKKCGFNFERAEQQFNQWWERKFIRRSDSIVEQDITRRREQSSEHQEP